MSMEIVEQILLNELKWLEKILRIVEKRFTDVPKGYLRFKKKGKKTEYYYKDATTGPGGRYIRKDEKKLAQQIAQRDYDMQVKKYAASRISAIEEFLKIYSKTSLKELYEETHPHRRDLIEPVILSDEEYVKRWQEKTYQGKGFEEDAPEILTEKGERVRSKSEKIIADQLYAMGVPYRYECPIVLSGSIKVYPDFTILKMPERKEVYLEHLGMMDDEGYLNTTLMKMNTYEKNGIVLGVNLFITYETKNRPLNTKSLGVLIRKVFSNGV